MDYIYTTEEIDNFKFKIGRGRPLPYGANNIENGVNFSLYSSDVDSVTLVIFESGKEFPLFEKELKEELNTTGDVWHIHIEGLPEDFKYGYRLSGEFNPKKGFYFNESNIVSDPYSLALSGGSEWGKEFVRKEGQYYGYRRRSFMNNETFNWENDVHPKVPFKDTIIYELHLRGFTQDKSSEVKERGTYIGLTEKIPYLKELGITAVELLPIQEFNELENIFTNPDTGERLYNFWGYSTLSFFAPKGSYASSGIEGGQVNEFKEMVKSFHNAGIEVILDIVYNHTGEGNSEDVVFSFKGIDANTYYMINDEGYHMNYSGCGNTFNCNHPVVRNFIMDSLRYWVTEMHVDGFRFDLASIMGRDEKGNVLSNPPIVEQIAKDPVLANTKIIAEAWDAAGLYQVGNFPGERWAEWNGMYRDSVKKLINGQEGSLKEFLVRFMGSPDLYKTSNRSPFHSINFITSHDGFTMWDLVSYNNKHNEANGEDGRDGDNNNNSYNNGFEGETDDTIIIKQRKRQVRNFFTLLFLSHGTPMITAGDEFLRTQKGNNNAYCQDNDISWINWEFLKENNDTYHFVKNLIEFRKNSQFIGFESFDEIENNIGMQYYGMELEELTENDIEDYSKSLAILIINKGVKKGKTEKMYIAFNFWTEPLRFKLPNEKWKLKIDTDRITPFFKEALSINREYIIVHPKSIVLMICEK